MEPWGGCEAGPGGFGEGGPVLVDCGFEGSFESLIEGFFGTRIS